MRKYAFVTTLLLGFVLALQAVSEGEAAAGYVSVSVEHVFSNAEKTREHMRKARGGLRKRMDAAILAITRDPQAILGRPKDVSFAIDRVVEWNWSHAALKGRIRTDRIAVIGHSYGASTVMTVCGARPILDHLDPPVPPGKGLAGDLSDPRVTVGIAMSPQGPGTSRFGRKSYATIDRPLLCLSGTKDEQFSHDGKTQPATRRLEGFRLFPPGEHILLWLENTDHMAFAHNEKEHLFPSESREDTQRITKRMSLLFCDARLKDDEGARSRLNERYVNSLTGKVVTRVTWHER